ncbi:MAG: alpha-xylosidase [Cellvibrionaceae bacterium]|nr:alpha-xylosidase [Cellvibrionaceae bacterium]
MNAFEMNTPAWNELPAQAVKRISINKDQQSVSVDLGAGHLVVSLHALGARLQFVDTDQAGQVDDFVERYGMLTELPAAMNLTLNEEANESIVSGGSHRLVIGHQPLSFKLFKDDRLVQASPSDGHFVRQFRLPPVARLEQGWFVSLELDHSEPVYGLGEKWGKLDKRGQLIRSYNHDALGVNAEISYKNSPFAWSPSGWGAFVHTPSPVTHAVGYANWSQRSYGLLVEADRMDLWLLSAADGESMLADYTELTGRAPVPPVWSLGVILSKAYYKDVEELLATAKEVREHKMPCDVITLDGRAWQDTDTRFAFEWDPKRYSDPAAVIDQLKAMNFKVCVWEYPLVSVQHPLFDEMASKGWLLKDRRSGDTYRYQWDTSCFGEVLTPLPDSGIVDFTHPEAFAFWKESHKPLFDLGVDMIKADFGEQIEADMLAYNGDAGDKLHNVYSLLYNRCVYEAADAYCKTGPFLFSRSSWTGSQRYPAQWGGDPQADWGGLAGSLRGGLSWGMTGAPYYATDVGGFYADQRDADLYVRWTQAAVFSAHIRLHGIGPREPWSYGAQAEAAVDKALKLRYQLLPYLHQTMQAASETGLPVQRAMALACPQDRAAWAFEEQFFFGEQLLVAPCLNPEGSISCYLPASISTIWRRFPSGETFAGGQVVNLTLALDELAVFVPEGAEIPLGPEVESTEDLDGELKIERWWKSC